MSDHFQMLVDVDATVKEAAPLSLALVDRFRLLGVITGEANSECVLGGEGYRPGPTISGLYELRKSEGRFWELSTSGVEIHVGRGFNVWALGPAYHWFVCPSCEAEIDLFADDVSRHAVDKALNDWCSGVDSPLVGCPKCRTSCSIIVWRCKPPLGFGNLSVRFWNWPRLDAPAWKIDLATILREVTGHTIVSTFGKL
jgi:hypothetical protein